MAHLKVETWLTPGTESWGTANDEAVFSAGHVPIVYEAPITVPVVYEVPLPIPMPKEHHRVETLSWSPGDEEVTWSASSLTGTTAAPFTMSRPEAACLLVLCLHFMLVLLHVVLPATSVYGYVIDRATQLPFSYRLNGLRCQIATVLLWYGCWMKVLLPGGWFGYPIATLAVDEFWAVVSTSNVLGFVLSGYFMWRAKRQLFRGSDPNLVAGHRSLRALTRDQLSRQPPSPPPAAPWSKDRSATTSIVKPPQSRSPTKGGSTVRLGTAASSPMLVEESSRDHSLRRSPRFTPQKNVIYTTAAANSAPEHDANNSCRRKQSSSRGHRTDAAVKCAAYNDNRSLSPVQHSSTRRPLPPPPTVMAAAGSGAGPRLSDFYAGLDFNPRLFRDRSFDVKMWLYLVGACVLQWVLLSALAKEGLTRQEHAHTHVSASSNSGSTMSGSVVDVGAIQHCSRAMLTFASLLTYFVAEYMYWEEPHLYTYDLFCEKLGFKLAWGCTCFYPLFYPIGCWGLLAAADANAINQQSHSRSNYSSRYGAQEDGDVSQLVCAAIVALFFVGNVLTRGANLQKYYFKTDPRQRYVLFGLVEQRTVPGTKLLCSGFWGTARHVNYLGEIVQAMALALPATLQPGVPPPLVALAWAYPLYYICLFIPRQVDDDAQCAAKYGPEVWEEYCAIVPCRIIPGIY